LIKAPPSPALIRGADSAGPLSAYSPSTDRPNPAGPNTAGDTLNQKAMSTQQEMQAPLPERPKRKLRPDVAARFTAKAARTDLADLYAKPLAELTPDELRKMKSAFLLGL
jgi:hypothetical protein